MNDMATSLYPGGIVQANYAANTTKTALQDKNSGMAWQREMERAQLASWFHPPVLAGSHHAMTMRDVGAKVAVQGPPAIAVDTPAHMNAGAPAIDMLSLTKTVSGAVNWPCDAGPVQAEETSAVEIKVSQGMANASPPQKSAAVSVQPSTQNTSNPGEPLSALPSLNAPDQKQAAIRLHAQWSAQGVQVWLGIDGDASVIEQHAARIVSQLEQTLQAQGLCLDSVVCNGRRLSLAQPGAQFFNLYSSKESS